MLKPVAGTDCLFYLERSPDVSKEEIEEAVKEGLAYYKSLIEQNELDGNICTKDTQEEQLSF